jgi:dihydroorotase
MNHPLYKITRSIASCCAVLSLAVASVHAFAQAPNLAYDLIRQNGHVIDDKNHVDSVMDVAIKDGKIAKVAPHIASSGCSQDHQRQGPLHHTWPH